MNILIVHNGYKKHGGEDVVFESEVRLLRDNEHSVKEYYVNNNQLKDEGLMNKIRIAINTIWSFRHYREIKECIQQFSPDIVHVHNTFPQFSPSIYWAIKSFDIPIVQTIHNYRLGCVNGLLYNNGKICMDCIEKGLIHSLKNKCYRNSFFATLPITLMLKFHWMIGTYQKKIDKFIALTDFSKSIITKLGIKEEKIIVKPNFTEIVQDRTRKKLNERKRQFIYVGRITEEKGVDLLIESFNEIKTDWNLVIIGDGPCKQTFQEKTRNNPNIIWKGFMERDETINEISESYALIMPSKLFETFGMVIVEAYSMGTPVIVPDHGGFPSLVTNRTGVIFENNNFKSLTIKIREIIFCSNWEELSRNCVEEYYNKYTKGINYSRMLRIYLDLIKKGRS